MKTITNTIYENMGEYLRQDSNIIFVCEYCNAEFTDDISCVRHELEHLYQSEKGNFSIIADGEQIQLPATFAEFETLFDELVYCDNSLEIVIEALTACELFMIMEEYGFADLPSQYSKAYMNRVGHYLADATSWKFGHWYLYNKTEVFAESYDEATVELASMYGHIDCAEVFKV